MRSSCRRRRSTTRAAARVTSARERCAGPGYSLSHENGSKSDSARSGASIAVWKWPSSSSAIRASSHNEVLSRVARRARWIPTPIAGKRSGTNWPRTGVGRSAPQLPLGEVSEARGDRRTQHGCRRAGFFKEKGRDTVSKIFEYSTSGHGYDAERAGQSRTRHPRPRGSALPGTSRSTSP